jgi:hypothetical protein
VTALLAAYALALHTLLASFAAFPLSASTADDVATFALCQHEAAPDGAGTPERGAADTHCPFCVVGAPGLILAQPSLPVAPVASELAWTAHAADLPNFPQSSGTRTRGPPLAA